MIACIMIQLRVELEGTRLLVLEAADHLDKFGNKKARGILAMAKVKDVMYICDSVRNGPK